MFIGFAIITPTHTTKVKCQIIDEIERTKYYESSDGGNKFNQS